MSDTVANKAVFDAAYADGAIAAEVAAARGDRSSLNNRLACISNFASPNAGGLVVGNYYDNCFQGSASGTLAGAAGRMTLAPFYSSDHLKVDVIGVAVSTAVAAALGKVIVYASGADNWPSALLYESADLDFSTTGFKSAAISPVLELDAGRQYWVGVRESSTATLRTVAVASAVNLGIAGNAGSSYYTVLRRTLAYASPTPANWNFVAADLTANITPPSIRMRAAA